MGTKQVVEVFPLEGDVIPLTVTIESEAELTPLEEKTLILQAALALLETADVKDFVNEFGEEGEERYNELMEEILQLVAREIRPGMEL